MRILVVNHRDLRNPLAGGLEELVHQTGRYWTQWGHEVDLLCAGYTGAARAEVLDGMRVSRGPNEYLFNWWAPFKVRALRGGRYDVVLEYISKVPCYIPLVLRQTPTAVMVPHLFGKTAFAELPWLMAAYAYALEQPIPWVYRRSLFWALSKTTAEDLKARGIPQSQTEIIYPGFNADLLETKGMPPKTPGPSLIYIGRLKRYKRLDLTIRATASLRERFPNIHFFIVGTGDYEPQLRQQVASLGLEQSVEFCGFVSEERKRELLNMAWVGVQTSTIEGWGLGVIEAGACGTPTVASDSPGLRESVRDGNTGFLVPHDNLDALIQALCRLLSDDALRGKMGVAARGWAKGFSWEEMSRHALQFLERAAEKRK